MRRSSLPEALSRSVSMLVHIKKLGRRLAADEAGVTLLEYTILLALITVGTMAMIATVGTTVTAQWGGFSTTLSK